MQLCVCSFAAAKKSQLQVVQVIKDGGRERHAEKGKKEIVCVTAQPRQYIPIMSTTVGHFWDFLLTEEWRQVFVTMVCHSFTAICRK